MTKANNIKSMTGYGRASTTFEQYTLEVELRSVNSRYFDFKIKLPNELNFMQDQIKNQIHAEVKRGKCEVFIKCETIDSNSEAKIDRAQAEAYYNDIKDLDFFKPTLGDSGPSVIRPFDISRILLLPGVIAKDNISESIGEEELKNHMSDLINEALNELLEMKKFEGKKLAEAILELACALETKLIEVQQCTTGCEDIYLKRYKERIDEMLATAKVDNIDESRIILEAAILADKRSIEEEIVRMQSHLAHLRDLLANEDNVGKRLDFLMQEMNREVNTMGSKSDDLKVIELVMAMKSDIENMREQVQNLE